MIEEATYWAWEYREADGTKCYVLFRLEGDRSVIGLEEAADLTVEQAIYADYHESEDLGE